jgi:hypothetical protein
MYKTMKTKPKYIKGDRCCLMYPVGKNQLIECIDDNMVIDGKPTWRDNQWWYPIVDRANPCEEKLLDIYNESM